MSEKETFMREVQKVEDSLQDFLHKANVIEKKLRTKLLSSEDREKLEADLEDTKKALKVNEQKLQRLRKENTKSFMIASCLFFICFLIFGLYKMIFG